jgi:Lon protease-like protein
VQAQELPDGGYALATVGMRRIEINRWLPDDPFPQAEVVELEDIASDSDDARHARVVSAFAAVCDLHRRIDPRLPEMPKFDAGPAQAAYEVAALAPIGPLDAQRVLEAATTGDRLDLLVDLLDDHARVLRAATPPD